MNASPFSDEPDREREASACRVRDGEGSRSCGAGRGGARRVARGCDALFTSKGGQAALVWTLYSGSAADDVDKGESGQGRRALSAFFFLSALFSPQALKARLGLGETPREPAAAA